MRTVEEWHGKTDDSAIPERVKLRIIERQNNKCAITGQTFRAGDKIHFDHRTPLWLGGKNAESNLQAILEAPHIAKTKTEATVRAKINRIKSKALGIRKPKSSFATNKDGQWKRKLNGETVRR